MADAMVGSVVQYQLSAADAVKINKTRTAHVGNSAVAGQVVPLIVTTVNEFATKPPTVKISGRDSACSPSRSLWLRFARWRPLEKPKRVQEEQLSIHFSHSESPM